MYLMHKNDIVADVTFLMGTFIQIHSIYDRRLMPIGTYHPNLSVATSLLNSWYTMQTIPKNRQNINCIVNSLNTSISEAIEKSYMVSLTNCYWLKKNDSQISWDNINYHENGFSDELFPLLYNEVAKISNYKLPDLTTDGMLEKAWINLKGVPTLLKTGKFGLNANDKHLLSANEVIAYKVAKLMEIEHVEYYPIMLNNGELISATPCFIKNDSEEFVSGLQIMKEDRVSRYTFYKDICDKGFSTEVNNMILLDHILHNTDRHERNFGIIRDSDTLDYIRFAPIYDTGSCLGWNNNGNVSNLSKPFSENRNEQLSLIGKIPELPSSDMILSIIKETYELYNISEECYDIAQNELQESFKILQNI